MHSIYHIQARSGIRKAPGKKEVCHYECWFLVPLAKPWARVAIQTRFWPHFLYQHFQRAIPKVQSSAAGRNMDVKQLYKSIHRRKERWRQRCHYKRRVRNKQTLSWLLTRRCTFGMRSLPSEKIMRGQPAPRQGVKESFFIEPTFWKLRALAW